MFHFKGSFGQKFPRMNIVEARMMKMIARMDFVENNIAFFTNQQSHHSPFFENVLLTKHFALTGDRRYSHVYLG